MDLVDPRRYYDPSDRLAQFLLYLWWLRFGWEPLRLCVVVLVNSGGLATNTS